MPHSGAQTLSSRLSAALLLLIALAGPSGPVLALDAFEPDGTAAQASYIATSGSPQTHDIDPASDLDYVKFSLQAGDTCVVETSAAPADDVGDTVIRLYDTDGTALLASDDDSGTDYYSKLTHSFPAAGTYYVSIGSYSSRYTGTYRIAVTKVEAVHGHVTDGVNPLDRVGIWVVEADKAYDQPAGVAVTDAAGNYSCLVPNGTYRVTAHLHGYTCSPTYREVTVPGAAVADFTMTAVAPPGADGVTTCWAVLVGISDYAGTRNDLSYCDDDAEDFGAALAAGGNWQDTSIELVLNRQATADNIWAALQRMATHADADDLCIFFFSGHGTNGPDLPPIDEGGGNDEYLCETDLTDNIRDDDLGQWIATLPTQKVMVVLCACYSGGFIKGLVRTKGLGPGEAPRAPRNGFAQDLRRAMSAAGMHTRDLDDNGYGVVITAADDTETCAESDTLAHDVLVYYLLEGMRGPGDADGDGWLTAEEIHAYAAPKATQFNSGQHAQLYDAQPAAPFPYLHRGGPAPPHTVTITTAPSSAPNPVDSGGQVQCTVAAQDSLGHHLSYEWTARDASGSPAGSFNDAYAQGPVWTAPLVTAPGGAEYTISVTVTCTQDPTVTASDSFTQQVTPVHQVTITAGPSGTPNPVASGGAVQCTVAAEDTWGHNLTYQWAARDSTGNAAGAFDDPAAPSPVWTAPAQTGDYTISVTVSCAQNPAVTASASYTQQVTPVHLVTITERPSGTPNPVPSGASVHCTVTAGDSHGHALTYQWAAEDAAGGPAGSFSNPALRSPTWTAPAVESATDYTITVTALCTQDPGISDAASFGQRVLPVARHTFGPGVQMVGVPIDLSFSGTMEQLLGASQVARWDPDGQDYFTDTSPSALCALGEGCWADFSSARAVQVPGTPFAAPQFTAAARPGWNLLALPWDQALPISAMSPDAPGGLPQIAWTYYDRDYHLVAPIEGLAGVTSQLEPWRGYWVFADSDCHISFDGTAAAAAVRTMSLGDASHADAWALQLIASAAGTVDSANYCGLSPRADALDAPNPPARQGAVDLYFTSAAGAARALDFSAQPAAQAHEWKLQVASPAAHQVTLTWPDLSAVPADCRLYLVDRDAGRTVYMRTTRSYQYTASAAPRHFLLRVVREGARPLAVTGLAVRQAASGPITVSCTLSAAADLTVRVYNLAGRCVRTLADARPTPAGPHTTAWNLRSDAGLVVPAGRYLLQITARADDGAEASALAAVPVRR